MSSSVRVVNNHIAIHSVARGRRRTVNAARDELRAIVGIGGALVRCLGNRQARAELATGDTCGHKALLGAVKRDVTSEVAVRDFKGMSIDVHVTGECSTGDRHGSLQRRYDGIAAKKPRAADCTSGNIEADAVPVLGRGCHALNAVHPTAVNRAARHAEREFRICQISVIKIVPDGRTISLHSAALNVKDGRVRVIDGKIHAHAAIGAIDDGSTLHGKRRRAIRRIVQNRRRLFFVGSRIGQFDGSAF